MSSWDDFGENLGWNERWRDDVDGVEKLLKMIDTGIEEMKKNCLCELRRTI